MYNVNDLDFEEIFEVKPEHIKLVKNMWVDWYHCEFGAPCIDPKRPFGDSDVYDDMIDILELDKNQSYDNLRAYCDLLYGDMQKVLQILVRCGEIKPGYYKIESYGSKVTYIGHDMR